jgi:hypothetical protein
MTDGFAPKKPQHSVALFRQLTQSPTFPTRVLCGNHANIAGYTFAVGKAGWIAKVDFRSQSRDRSHSGMCHQLGAIKVVPQPHRQPADRVFRSSPVAADTSPLTRCGGLVYGEAATTPRATVVPPHSTAWFRAVNRDSMRWLVVRSVCVRAYSPTDVDAATEPAGHAVAARASISLEIGCLPATATAIAHPDDHSFTCLVPGPGSLLNVPLSTQSPTPPLTPGSIAWSL